MPRVSWTEALRTAHKYALEHKKQMEPALYRALQENPPSEDDDASIDFDVVVRLSQWLRKQPEAGRPAAVYAHQLVEGGRLVFPQPPKPPRNPELVARLERIQIEQDNRAYKRMVANVDPTAGTGHKVGSVAFQEDLREVRRDAGPITDIVNMLFSVFGVFAAAYAISSHLSNDVGMRALFSLGCAIVVLIAEFWLYNKYGKLGNAYDPRRPANPDRRVLAGRQVIASYSLGGKADGEPAAAITQGEGPKKAGKQD